VTTPPVPLSRICNFRQFIPDQRHIYIVEVKYCKENRRRSLLKAANEQHSVLHQHLCRAAAKVSLHTILLGVGGTISSPYSMEPFKNLSLELQKASKDKSNKSCLLSSSWTGVLDFLRSSFMLTLCTMLISLFRPHAQHGHVRRSIAGDNVLHVILLGVGCVIYIPHTLGCKGYNRKAFSQEVRLLACS